MALKAEDIRKYIKRTVIAKLKVLLVPGLRRRIFQFNSILSQHIFER